MERRRVSVRWLCGTVLTGFAGAGLIAAAIYAALGGQADFAEAPQLALARREAMVSEFVNPGKGDRLVKSIDIVAAKQTFRTPVTVAVGDKEVVRTRAFTRVATPLAQASGGLSDEVPPFNPLKLLSDSRAAPPGEPVEPGPSQDDAEVSFSTRDLGPVSFDERGAVLSANEARAQIDEFIKNAIAAGAKAPIPLPAQLLLMRTSHVGADPAGGLSYAPLGGDVVSAPFSSIQVRMVPENVTQIPRTSAAADKAREQLVVVRRGDGLDDVLRAAGVSGDQIRAALAGFNTRRGARALGEGQRVKLMFMDGPGSEQTRQLARYSIYSDDKLDTTLALSDAGAFVEVERTSAPPPKRRDADEDDDDESAFRLYNAFYETALKSDIPRTLIDDLVRIFANDVDFQRPVQSGDNFEAFYSEGEEGDQRHELLYASITSRNETFRYYRYGADESSVDYFDQNGRSTRKFLVRQPIAVARVTSGFGSRFHPILGYTRMHTGVDFASAVGTPIFAAGNGAVIKAGRESGYGNRVEIQHANGYITTYNHLQGFARGLAEGARVRQGQLIGYLGMTGLATGPHLHYEVIVNGHFVDPMRVKLARTRELDGKSIVGFRRERDKIDVLMAKAPGATRVASRQGAAAD